MRPATASTWDPIRTSMTCSAWPPTGPSCPASGSCRPPACWSQGRHRACWSTGPWCTAWWSALAARTSPAACRTTAATRRSRPTTPRLRPTRRSGSGSGPGTCPATRPAISMQYGSSRPVRRPQPSPRRRHDPLVRSLLEPTVTDDRAASLAEVCVVACAEAWRGDGAILASPMGLIPSLGARLARLTFAPDLLLTDGEAYLVDAEGRVEGWLPYAKVFTMLAAGRRHVMMGAAQIDRHGNQNISAIGDWKRPKAQLLGVRGAPGNTVNHPVSYWVPRHSPRVFTAHVDMVCGVGYDRGAHELRVVVTNLAVLDFQTPERVMRL